MLVNYACLLRDELPPYAVSAIGEQLQHLAAEDAASGSDKTGNHPVNSMQFFD